MRVLSLGALALAILVSASVNVQTQNGSTAAAKAAPTFSKDVAPILYNKCVSCHRAGEIGPMSLITYREVRPWVASIRDKVSTSDRPPGHGEPQYGSCRHA